ncbi:MAG: ComEC/Rec2 family competence protein [Phycisphaeraceae bacterium]|nr:ComEC/Rec2 family competence protein [Phycisphaeraceae bacterium]
MSSPDPSTSTPHDAPRHAIFSPLVLAACAWIAGVALSELNLPSSVWLSLGALAVLAGVISPRLLNQPRLTFACALVAVALTAAAWTAVRQEAENTTSIRAYLQPQPRLVVLTGVIASPPLTRSRDAPGPLGHFIYQPRTTNFALDVESVSQGPGLRPARGGLIVKISEETPGLKLGQRLTVKGWLAPFGAPGNPGQRDYRAILQSRGLEGELALPSGEQLQILPPNTWGRTVDAWRIAAAAAALSALNLGLPEQTPTTAFLDAVLLGWPQTGIRNLYEDFQRAGVAHILSISGAHLVILMGLVWAAAKLATGQPRIAALLALLTLGLYLLVLPAQVPILRAGLMAGLYCFSYATGRQWRALNLLAAATLGVLILWPRELFSPGFQLSFGIVAGLLIFTQPLALRLERWRQPLGELSLPLRPWARWRRNILVFLSANVVASLIALPLVAYHFGMICLGGFLLSPLVGPVISLILALGYCKILLGLLAPVAGAWLAHGLDGLGAVAIAAVGNVAHWPYSVIELGRPPGALWLWATQALVIYVLATSGRQKSLKLTAGVPALPGAGVLPGVLPGAGVGAGLVAWLVIAAGLLPTGWQMRTQAHAPVLAVNMLDVGDGQCVLIRARDGWQSSAVLFDCGSAQQAEVGKRTILPALRYLGVRKLDAVFISQANIDHFNGCLDVVDALAVRTVYVPPGAIWKSEADKQSALGVLMDHLRARGLAVRAVERGWTQNWPGLKIQALWPTPEGSEDLDGRNNDPQEDALVLRMESPATGTRVLLHSDLKPPALAALQTAYPGLHAEIVNLPAHGAYNPPIENYLRQLKPAVMLQSAGARRMRRDRWQESTARDLAPRLATHHTGMAEVLVGPEGKISWTTFKKQNAEETALRDEEIKNQPND